MVLVLVKDDNPVGKNSKNILISLIMGHYAIDGQKTTHFKCMRTQY